VGTDEASLVEHLGEAVHVILGSDRNIKITRPTDMALAHLFFQEEVEHLAEAGAVPAS
jgi:2-C-methyl-D-erythritol 4-phosphate cytidylyltransferase